jgi:hypothetical protein
MDEIQIEGLTSAQVFICELLYTSEDPDSIIAHMPKGMAREARVLKQMIVLAEIDRCVAEMPQSEINRNISNLFG